MKTIHKALLTTIGVGYICAITQVVIDETQEKLQQKGLGSKPKPPEVSLVIYQSRSVKKMNKASKGEF